MAKAIWLLNIASLLIACTTTIAGRVGFSISYVNTLILGEALYTIGSYLFIIPQFQNTFELALLARIIQNIGLGFCVRQQNPINKQYSKNGNIQKAMMVAGICVPFFCIIGSLLAGKFQEDFQVNYIIIGSICLVFIILQLIFFPVQCKLLNKLQIDFISVILFCISICLLLYGFMNFAQNEDQLILSICLVVGGFIVFIIFIIYDQKVSKAKIFMKGLINKETIKGWSLCFLSQLPYTNVSTQMSSIFKKVYNVDSKTIGIYTAISSLTIIISAILGTVLNQKIVTKYILSFNFFMWFALQFATGLQLYFLVNKWFQYICDGLCIFCYGIHLVITINWLFEFVPIVYDSSLATMNQIINQVGNAFGSTLSVLIVEFTSENMITETQNDVAKVYGINDIVFGLICLLSIVLCCSMPQFEFEQSKKLFNSNKQQNSKKLFKQVSSWNDIIELA